MGIFWASLNWYFRIVQIKISQTFQRVFQRSFMGYIRGFLKGISDLLTWNCRGIQMGISLIFKGIFLDIFNGKFQRSSERYLKGFLVGVSEVFNGEFQGLIKRVFQEDFRQEFLKLKKVTSKGFKLAFQCIFSGYLRISQMGIPLTFRWVFQKPLKGVFQGPLKSYFRGL